MPEDTPVNVVAIPDEAKVASVRTRRDSIGQTITACCAIAAVTFLAFEDKVSGEVAVALIGGALGYAGANFKAMVRGK